MLEDFDSFLESAADRPRKPNFPFSLHYSQGVKALRLQHFSRAIEHFNDALEKEPNDGKALLNRCKARMGVLQYQEAKADAEAALEQLPQSAEAYHLKAQAECMMLDLENGFLTYGRGRGLRPGNCTLIRWQNVCEKALANSFRGTTNATVDSDDIQKLERTGKGNYKIAKTVKSEFFHYERFAEDKKLLEDLLSDQEVKSVHRFCRDGLDVIRQNMAVGSMFNPVFDRKKKPPSFRKQVAKQSSVLRYVHSILRRCESYLHVEGSLEQCFSEASRLLEVIDARTELAPQLKRQLEMDVFHVLGLAHEKQNHDLRCLTLMEAELGAAQGCGVVVKELRALHSLGERYLRRNMLASAVKCANRILSSLSSEKVRSEQQQLTPDVFDAVQKAVAWAKKLNNRIRRNVRESVIDTAVCVVERMYERVGNFEDFPELLDSVREVSESDLHITDSFVSVSDCSSFKESDG